jgi:kinesin family protein 6/9
MYFVPSPSQVSYLEIYNDQMYDLLSEHPANSESLAILEDNVNGTYVSPVVL